MPDIETRIATAYQNHVAGQAAAAERAYRAVLADHPGQVDTLFLLSSLLSAQPAEALALARQAVESSGGAGGLGVEEYALHDHYAACLRRAGADPGAEARHLVQAESLNPGAAERLFYLADALRRDGQLAAAADALERYLACRPDDVNAKSNLGAVQFQLGRFAAAAESLLDVVLRIPAHPEALNNLGNALSELGRVDLAAERYRAAVEARPDFAEAWLNLAGALDTLSRADEALAAYRQALLLAPDNERAKLGLHGLYEKIVPRWHFPMMNDHRRNEAYERAIVRAVARCKAAGPAPQVLDIGTGSGLLSMMAARAGAGRVDTCEMVELVADVAETIVARNGYADRIDVHRMKSTRLEVGVQMPRRADILVTEIFDVGLLGEFALPTLAHARQSLLAEGACIIPAGARAWMMPIESQEIYDIFRVRNDNACGFDLEPFNRYAKIGYHQLALSRYSHRALAAPQPVFDFDFRQDIPERETVLHIEPTRNGTVHAWVFWFTLSLDDETEFDTGPYVPGTCWAQAVQHVPQPVAAVQGVPLLVRAVQTQTSIYFSHAPS